MPKNWFFDGGEVEKACYLKNYPWPYKNTEKHLKGSVFNVEFESALYSDVLGSLFIDIWLYW